MYCFVVPQTSKIFVILLEFNTKVLLCEQNPLFHWDTSNTFMCGVCMSFKGAFEQLWHLYDPNANVLVKCSKSECCDLVNVVF